MIMDGKIVTELKKVQAGLNGQGKFLSKAQLGAFYETFRQRFGPERLKNLDGEALLEAIHNHSKRDSLVYWLEFKNDEELPGIMFGSIAGGSALKFGIYRRKETGVWMKGSPQNQQELSTQEAIQIARNHRDQLLKGAELLERLPVNGSDSDYATLQQDMDRLAPDVGNSSWGHKYFYMLYPEKLDDFHNPDYQRFYLIKLLQEPPQGDGRYIAAGRYVAIAKELDVPINHLTTILWNIDGSPYRYWRIGTSDSTQPRNRWALMRDGNCVAVGWAELGDLKGLTYSRESKEEVRAKMESNFPGTPQNVGRQTQQVFNFVVAIGKRDLVLASDGATVLGIGRVIGEYTFDPASDFPHRRPVEWLQLEEWRILNPEGLRTTLHEVRQVKNLVEIERRIIGAPPITVIQEPPAGSTLKKSFSPQLKGVAGRIQSVLERKGQVILYGPPGTGKTFWARSTACDLAAYYTFGIAFTQLSDDKRVVIVGTNQGSDGLVRMCTFHPAYGYEDFLEGYKPVSENNQLAFERRDGVFKKLCADAQENPKDRFYLIIDEINRGDIPRIFGELLTVLEKDKRGMSILLPLSGLPFHVPPNVHVIGTMNTADRSIALLDTALRRRFGFVELMPDSSVLGNVVIEGIPLGPWLDALNRRICDHIGRDARNLQVGHAYLLDGSQPIAEFAKFIRIVQEDIVPLLEEYCYEDYRALENILGKGLVDESGQRIRHELFDASRRTDLVQALLERCPVIVTSAPAVTSGPVEAEGNLEENDEKDTEDGSKPT